MNSSHWHILGAGAMGCLFANALRESGCRITLLLRDGTGAGATVMVETDTGERQFSAAISACSDHTRIGHLLVTTKAYDVHEALGSVAHRLGPDSQVLFMVNGMGFAPDADEEIAYYYGTSTEGAYRLSPLHIRHAGSGATRIGSPGRAQPAPWFGDWSGSPLKCLWDPDIDSALWHKLAINCAINPLTALHRCNNGELAAREELAGEVAALCDEIALVSEAAGYPGTAARLHQEVAGVIAGTAANRSSMLQDVLAGRRTEIDYITGHLLLVARQHHIDAPHNRVIHKEIKALEY